ncbi:ABC transporter substrate-binding protein [Cohnella fermenti]|uniref:Fe/B12 periplasmic-binding domain-containing protein n=1 Tax=Cohnella fermenti TaxID=2565925 RepID=A0A4S4BNY5_9BACL|nr:ABC transporter substrate-binding protein [Cohnella fermenti]THF76047.1 hypothetical protein E6C55_19910 [Cohnella fermenti]
MHAPHWTKSASAIAALLLCVLMLAACGSGTNNNASPSPSGSNGEGAGESAAAPASAAASASPEAEPATRSYTDALGRTVDIPTHAQRIVAHYYASELTALEVPFVGTNYNNAKLSLSETQLQGTEDIGGENLVPNLEKTLSLAPDLIIVPDFLEAPDLDSLSKIAPTVAVKYSDDPFTHLRTLADILGQQEAAERWIGAYEAKIEEKRKLVQPVIAEGETASAFIVYGDKQLYVYNKQRLGPTLYDAFGFAQPAKIAELFQDKPDSLWETLSLELLPEYAGDRVFLVTPDNNEEAAAAAKDILNGPIWGSLPAVKNGKAYIVSGRWGLNDPLTLDWLLDQAADMLTKPQQ